MKTIKRATLAFAAVALFSLSSCEVCTTCTYTYTAGGDTITVEQPEFCGSKSEVDDVKDAAQAAAEALATTGGGVAADATATCVDN